MHKLLSVTSVVPSVSAGGIGSVCHYAAEGLASQFGWDVTLLALHDPPSTRVDPTTGLRIVGLGAGQDSPQVFLDWLEENPQNVVITSNVGMLEAAFPYFPAGTCHILQLHDSLVPYRRFVARNACYASGVVCVADHITEKIRSELRRSKYAGLVGTVHNGANYPEPAIARTQHPSIRCLFIGFVDAFKGAYDIVPLLKALRRSSVPVAVDIVGGRCSRLEQMLVKSSLAGSVAWRGRVAHKECYAFASEADVFLMLSRKEPFGMVTIEAMSMGCVPIAYNTPSGSTEIIEHNKNGILVPLGDIRSMAKEIADLHSNRKRLSVLSTNAVHRARSDFTQSKMCAHLGRFVEDVVKHSQSHPTALKQGRPEISTKLPRWAKRTGYRRLPDSWREWLRMQFFRRHSLAYWWLDR